jgi:BirA family biotin operon repressor/biotin-[acetyl-CoA-carboxylase] ligase
MLAIAGAPHGTLVTAAEQTAGRGRQGRSWTAPPGSALLCSLVLRDPPALLSLIAGVAACDAIGEHARVKWPNDIVVEPDLGKLAGILVEGRPQDGWAVLGIGVNVAVRVEELPTEVRPGAASLELSASAIEPLLADLLVAFTRRLAEPADALLEAWRTRDVLRGREITWTHPKGTRQGHGQAEGVDNEGRLLVLREDGTTTALSAGEVHFESVG